MTTKILTALSIDGIIENIINFNEKLFDFPESNNIIITDYEKYKKMMSDAPYLTSNVILLINNKYSENSQDYTNLINLINNNNVSCIKCSDLNNALLTSNNIKDKYKNIFIIGEYNIYEEIIDKCSDIDIIWINKMYSDEEIEQLTSKKFPITKLFNDFEMINDYGWLKNNNNTLYKIVNYKNIA